MLLAFRPFGLIRITTQLLKRNDEQTVREALAGVVPVEAHHARFELYSEYG